MNSVRESLKKSRRVVLKAGTSILSSENGKFSRRAVARLGNQIVKLWEEKRDVVLVSSGAVAMGMETLNLKTRPTELKRLQACAAIGQGKLMHAYEEFFSGHSLHTAQILLTRDGLEARNRYLNAKRTFDELFSLGVLPIVNENDSVATEEIAFGDNDLLSVWVSILVRADLLVILSDVEGFYLKDKSRVSSVGSLSELQALSRHLQDKSRQRTVGGMRAKLTAAKIAMQAGIPLLLVNGHENGILRNALKGEDKGTLFADLNRKKGDRLLFTKKDGKSSLSPF